MRIDLLRQAEALGLAALIGLGAGLLYDLLRPPRRRSRRPAALLADALFCLVLGAALFLFAMSFGDGRLGLAALAAVAAGFLAHQALLSPLWLPLFDKLFQYLDIVPAFLKKTLKKPRFLKNNTLKKQKNDI